MECPSASTSLNSRKRQNVSGEKPSKKQPQVCSVTKKCLTRHLMNVHNKEDLVQNNIEGKNTLSCLIVAETVINEEPDVYMENGVPTIDAYSCHVCHHLFASTDDHVCQPEPKKDKNKVKKEIKREVLEDAKVPNESKIHIRKEFSTPEFNSLTEIKTRELKPSAPALQSSTFTFSKKRIPPQILNLIREEFAENIKTKSYPTAARAREGLKKLHEKEPNSEVFQRPVEKFRICVNNEINKIRQRQKKKSKKSNQNRKPEKIETEANQISNPPETDNPPTETDQSSPLK